MRHATDSQRIMVQWTKSHFLTQLYKHKKNQHRDSAYDSTADHCARRTLGAKKECFLEDEGLRGTCDADSKTLDRFNAEWTYENAVESSSKDLAGRSLRFW
jgi:hypothetical protein